MLQTTNSELDINYNFRKEVLSMLRFSFSAWFWLLSIQKNINAVLCYGSPKIVRSMARDRALQSPRPVSGSGDWSPEPESRPGAGTGAGIVYAFVLLGETRVQDLTALKTKLNQTAQNCASQTNLN